MAMYAQCITAANSLNQLLDAEYRCERMAGSWASAAALMSSPAEPGLSEPDSNC